MVDVSKKASDAPAKDSGRASKSVPAEPKGKASSGTSNRNAKGGEKSSTSGSKSR